MTRIYLTDADLMPDPEVDTLKGTYLYRPHFDRVVRDTTTVFKPDGRPLLIYLKDALPRSLCQQQFAAFRLIRFGTTNSRGLVAGGKSFRRQRVDGSFEQTSRWRPMRSQVVGYLNADPRNPVCRLTAFTRSHTDLLVTLHPLLMRVNQLFQQFAPERWAAQQQFIQTVSPDLVLPNTVFTSVTVNRSERTAAHRDAHDYRPGLGVMAVLEGGRYYGGELIFPKYRTAVDMRTGGVCLADVHEWHGNAPLIGRRFLRLAFVFYAREQMHKCGSVEQEQQPATCGTASTSVVTPD